MLAAIMAVIIYRIFIVLLIYKSSDPVLKGQAKLITTITAACLSVIAITLLNKVYEKIAIFLTNMGMYLLPPINRSSGLWAIVFVEVTAAFNCFIKKGLSIFDINQLFGSCLHILT